MVRGLASGLNGRLLRVFPIVVSGNLCLVTIAQVEGWIGQEAHYSKVTESFPEPAHQHSFVPGPTDDETADQNIRADEHVSPSRNVLHGRGRRETGKDIGCAGQRGTIIRRVAIDTCGSAVLVPGSDHCSIPRDRSLG